MNADIFWPSFLSVSVLVATVRNYLTVNRIWKRKHIGPVTESISVAANLMFLTTAVPFFLYFVFAKNDTLAATNTGMGILVSSLFVFVGSGVWLPSSRSRRFSEKIRKALLLEKGEAGALLNPIITPRGVDEILRILNSIAMIDGEFHKNERAIIEKFAESNRLTVRYREEADGCRVPADYHGLDELHNLVRDYLAHNPPRDQVEEFTDLIQLVVWADRTMHDKERLVVEEILAMTDRFLAEQFDSKDLFEVVVVPQDNDHWLRSRELLPGKEPQKRDAGRMLSAGAYHSREYAAHVAERFHKAGLPALIVTEQTMQS